MLAGAVFLSMPIAVIGNQYEAAYNDYEKEIAMKDPVEKKTYGRKASHQYP